MNQRTFQAFIDILNDELLLATGCTEPIAIAYAAAYARNILGATPERVEIAVSSNILKNVKGVVVPNTNGRKGVSAAVAAGIVAGDSQKQLQVIASVCDTDVAAIGAYLDSTPIQVSCLPNGRSFDILIRVYRGNCSATVRIANHHTNVVYADENGRVLLDLPVTDSAEENLADKSVLNIADILSFAETVPLELVRPLLQRQIDCNSAIAEEGLRGNYGGCVGKTLLHLGRGDIETEARAYAAAGSDARMSGCEMPVVILSGSGNQGMTASLPVIRYAHFQGASEEQLLRALLVSDLVSIYQKVSIGRLSAFCGAVSAGCGAGAGVAYLLGGNREIIEQTIQNALAIAAGIVCDGAKPSCAGKISMAVEAGLLGCRMSFDNRAFHSGDGILQGNADDTIRAVGRIASEGMIKTDEVIVSIMCP